MSPNSLIPVASPDGTNAAKDATSASSTSTNSDSCKTTSSKKSRGPSKQKSLAQGAAKLGVPEALTRESLLESAGITRDVQVSAIAAAFQKQLDLMSATVTKYFAFEGEVRDQREVTCPEVQLKAAESVHQILGTFAPKTQKEVKVVYHVQIPEWYQTPGEVVDVEVVREAE